MIFPKKLKPEQLQADYKAPTKEAGVRTTSAGGQLQTAPAFTTSAKAGEARQDARPNNTSTSTGYARSVEGHTPQSNSRERPANLPAPPVGGRYEPAVPDLFGRPAMSVSENSRPKVIDPNAEAPVVYQLKNKKTNNNNNDDSTNKGWRYKFEQEGGTIK